MGCAFPLKILQSWTFLGAAIAFFGSGPLTTVAEHGSEGSDVINIRFGKQSVEMQGCQTASFRVNLGAIVANKQAIL